MKRIVFLAPLFFSSAAHADTTAVYANAPAGFSMTLKVASNGDIRGEVPGRTYYYVGGKDYFAEATDTGTIVMTLDDMAKVMADRFAELTAKIGVPQFSPPPMSLVQMGALTIGKWTGDAYYMKAANGQVSPRPVTVISHDPTLAELGRAMERQFAKSEALIGGVMGGHAPTSNMAEALRSGAPIYFAGAQLQSVNFDPISKGQFVLPSQPVAIDEVRKRMSRQ